MRILVSALLLSLATGVQAGMPQYDLSKVTKGSTAKWTSYLGDFTVKLNGKSQGKYVFDYKRDASQDNPLAARSWANANGDTVKAKFGAITVKLTPHDCSMTMGECKYTRTVGKDQAQNLVRKSTFQNGWVVYKVFNQTTGTNVLEEEGRYKTRCIWVFS